MTRKSAALFTLIIVAAGIGVFCADFADLPAGHRGVEPGAIEPAETTADLATLLSDNSGDNLAYWRDKPHLKAAFAYQIEPRFSAADRETAARLSAGEFAPSRHFAWTRPGVPPPWDYNPDNNRTYDFYKHSLQWVVPLIEKWVCDADPDALTLTKRIITDWVLGNPTPPGASAYAWRDHTTSYRTRLFCWFWELWRDQAPDDPEFTRLFLAAVHRHATFLADDRNYTPTSNHALHMDGSLLAAAVTFPEFKDATRWRSVVDTRLAAYVARNFSPEGFNLEQSPFYHWYVIGRLGEITEFLRANDQAVNPAVADALDRAISVWPYLIRPDWLLPNVGDSGGGASRSWPAQARAYLGHEPPPPAPSSIANPRTDDAGFFLSSQVGYAFFTSYAVGEPDPAADTYVLFRCNSWPHSSHCHTDALSFELFGRGREWLVDSGRLNSEEDTLERRYMRSPRAHNVLLVDDSDFGFNPVELVDSGRTPECDFVSARHALPTAWHTRRFEFHPDRTIRLVDTVESRDDRPHLCSQLFQVAPNLRVDVVSDSEIRLVAPDGRMCVITQIGDAGAWSTVTGQVEPFQQGWYSRKFNEREPITTVFYSTPRPRKRCEFVTEVVLRDEAFEEP